MSIKEIADDIYKVKRIGNEYVTKKEYKEYRKIDNIEKWDNKQENFDDRRLRLANIDFWKLNECINNIDKKFLKKIEAFITVKNIQPDRLTVVRDAKKIICSYIIERFDFLRNSRAIFVPKCENEYEVNLWFQDNCHNIGISIPSDYRRHSKLKLNSTVYSGIDYICKFIDTDKFALAHSNGDHNEYVPQLFKHLDDKQNFLYNRFLDFSEAYHLIIELEFLSSNFIKHKHPDIVDLIICYKKDHEINIPILNLSR